MKMDVLKIDKYWTPYGEIEFIPVKNVPGFDYVVYVDRIKRQDMYVKSGVRPSKKLAIFFARCIAGEREQNNKYYYTDKNIDPPTLKQWFKRLLDESAKCSICGASMETVRPGKIQCRVCG